MSNALGLVYIASFFFFLLIIYCVHIQLRRRRYRQIASELGAEYQSQGSFKSGKIAGSGNNRKYTVENEDGARGSSTWTVIQMQCVNKGIPLHIHGRFFKNFPNWKYAFTRGDRTERVFVTNVTLQNVGIPLEEKYKLEVQGLFQEFALLNYAFLRKGLLRIEQDTMSFTIRGILKDLEVIRQILSVLTRLADRIESEPIGDWGENQQKELIPASLSATLRRSATPTKV
jgi:hypothetical protein